MSKSDEAMMREIKSLVAASKVDKSKKQQKDLNSPYLVDLVKQLPAEYMLENDSAQTQERRELRIRKAAAKKRKPSGPDDLLNFYAARQRKDHGLEQEVIDTKAVTLPYGDVMMKVNEFVDLDKTLRSNTFSFEHYNSNYINGNKTLPKPLPVAKAPSKKERAADEALLADILNKWDAEQESNNTNNNKTQTSPPTPTYSSRFHRKYPRLCASFKFTNADIDAAASKHRSDYWIARFMEECFDEAYIACNTPVSKEDKWRLRNGLDLGSIDCFPKVVELLLGVRYSVLEIRTNICIEFLSALERLVALSETAHGADLPASAAAVQDMGEEVYDGERAQLFVKFLSEEYDLDFLAMFLQVRESVQTTFRFRLKDLNPVRVWVDGNDEYMIEKEKETIKSQLTYYRVQQLGETRNHPITSTISAANASYDGALIHPGEKRKFAWSAEALSLTAKLDAQIHRRRDREDSNNNLNSTQNAGEPSNNRSESPLRASLSRSTNNLKMEQTKSASTLKRSATASTFGMSAPPTGKRGRTTTADSGATQRSVFSAKESTPQPSEYGKKVVPVLLPNNWHFLHDLTLPEAPIVGFETGIISLVCMHLLPRCAQSIRTYLADRILAATKDSLMDTAAALKELAADSTVIDATGRVSVSTARESFAAGKVVRKIPLYILFKTLCLEWKKISLEAKVAFVESGAGAASLHSLNEIYKDNNELRRKMEEEILQVQKDLGASEAKVLGLDKALRRLERRRLAVIATPAEIDEIEQARIQLNEESMNK